MEDRRRFLESVRPLIGWLSCRLAPRGIEPDDLAQEAMLQVWQGCHQFDPSRGPAAAWVRIIVVRSASALARKRGKATPFPLTADGAALEVIDHRTPDPAEGVVTRDTAARVRLAVQTLPDRERRLVGMRYGSDGLTLAEAGSALGISGTRAGQIERRSFEKLRDVLG